MLVDDIFPHLLSAFRIAEYNAYLQAFPHAEVRSNGNSFRLVGDVRSFAEVHAEYAALFPRLASKVQLYTEDCIKQADGIYTIFINNIFQFIEPIDRWNKSFVFTLYPGGGLQLNDATCDQKLQRVFGSPGFRGVIVTQQIVRSYLLGRGFCPSEKIHFIYGCVVPEDQLRATPIQRTSAHDRGTFNICFVANKYMAGGLDKGFDVFIAVAQALAARSPSYRFHVVGGFGPDDVAPQTLSERLTFYGTRPTGFFPNFYATMDLMLAPNAPDKLGPGAFDGFPTGAAIEAGLCGVPICCTDPLGLNQVFRDAYDILIVPHHVATIVERIEHYRQRPRAHRQLSQRSRRTFQRVFSHRAQIAPRLALIDALLG